MHPLTRRRTLVNSSLPHLLLPILSALPYQYQPPLLFTRLIWTGLTQPPIACLLSSSPLNTHRRPYSFYPRQRPLLILVCLSLAFLLTHSRYRNQQHTHPRQRPFNSPHTHTRTHTDPRLTPKTHACYTHQ